MAARRLVRFVACIGWAACLGSIGLTLALPGVAASAALQWSPWALGLFLLGVPHGAFDHRVGSELGPGGGEGPAGGPRAGPGFYAAYLAAAAAVLATWWLSPIAASLGFLAVAAAHFGQGDVYWSRLSGLAGRSRSVGYRASLIAARSLVPVALPILASPDEFAGSAGSADGLASRLFGRGEWSIPPSIVGPGLGLVAASVAVQVAWAARLARPGDGPTRRLAAVEVAETLLLVATFAVVPPVLAVGVYFNAWHSLRHVARLLLIARGTREMVASGRLVPAFVEFQKRALPMTSGALALAVALGLFVGRSVLSAVDLGLVALIALSALTLPHVLVVAWMDARQGVWSARLDPG